MKKVTLMTALVAASLTLTGCGSSTGSIASSIGSSLLSGALSGNSSSSSSSTSSAVSTGTSLLGNLLSGVLGSSSKLTQSSLVGTWSYTGPDCVFESENLLAKAGGAVASTKIESQLDTYLSKVGIKKGACTFTFNNDGTYSAKLGSRTISGNYTVDSSAKTIKLTYLAGLGSATMHASLSSGNLSLLMESSKLLSLLKGVSAISSKSSTLTSLSSLLGNYDGLYIGLQMSK